MASIGSQPSRAEQLDVGRVVQRTFLVLRRGAVPLLLSGLLTVGMVALIFGGLRVSGVIAEQGDTATGAPGENLLSGLATCLVAGPAVRSTMAALRGRQERLGVLAKAGPRSFARVFGISFLAGLAILLGLILLVVPGLILWARWVAAIPASVVEDRPVSRSMDRSAKLTKGQRGRIVLLGVMGLLIAVAFILVLTLVEGAVQPLRWGVIMMNLVLWPLMSVFLVVLNNVGKTVIYAELTGASDQRTAMDLADVFA